MGMLSRLFGKKSTPASSSAEHAVIAKFDYIGSTDLAPLFELESKLESAIGAAQAGELDGNEVAVDGSDGSLYMYGPNADRLFGAIRPVLEGCSFMRGARITLRYGPPRADVRTRIVILGS
jgi:hypothetical protein